MRGMISSAGKDSRQVLLTSREQFFRRVKETGDAGKAGFGQSTDCDRSDSGGFVRARSG